MARGKRKREPGTRNQTGVPDAVDESTFGNTGSRFGGVVMGASLGAALVMMLLLFIVVVLKLLAWYRT